MEPDELNTKVETWIEEEMVHIGNRNQNKYDDNRELISIPER
jgi:1-acyl-sn-glycerol-3-phosphate acyltransferase